MPGQLCSRKESLVCQSKTTRSLLAVSSKSGVREVLIPWRIIFHLRPFLAVWRPTCTSIGHDCTPVSLESEEQAGHPDHGQHCHTGSHQPTQSLHAIGNTHTFDEAEQSQEQKQYCATETMQLRGVMQKFPTRRGK